MNLSPVSEEFQLSFGLPIRSGLLNTKSILKNVMGIGTTMVALFVVTANGPLMASPYTKGEIDKVHIANIVRGQVTNLKGEPLAGVSVTVKGATTGTFTDENGNYTIDVPVEGTLVFSYVGFGTREILVNGRSSLDVVIEEGASTLDQVVVVGYGTQKKVSLTGSVASISGEELKATPTINISNAITGLLPGVVTKNVSGEPGLDNATIYIRGRNTTGDNNPLVVVDGIQNASGWQRINSNDIESITVLKDASAAIYGAQAANGVILITTKRGVTGKPVISYTFNQGISQPTKIPKLGNSGTLAEYFNEMLVGQGQSPRYTDDEIRKFKDGSDPVNYPNTDWFHEVLRKHNFQSQHNLNVSGGSEDVKYLISGSYSNQNSIFKKGSLNFKTYSIRTNLDAQINKNIKLSLDMNGGMDDGNYPAYSTTETFEYLNANLPFEPVYYPNGLPSAGVEYGDNPIVMASSATGNENNVAQRFSTKVSFEINIPMVEGLGIDGYFNYRNDIFINKDWQTPWIVYNYDKTADTYIPVSGGQTSLPTLSQSLSRSRNTLANLRIKYNKNFNRQNLNAFIAAEQAQGVNDNFSGFRRDFISPNIDQLFAGSLLNQEANGQASETGRKNFFGRLHYDFSGKYLLDFNFRYDGSSNFPKGKQYGFFPGVSVAWRISQEEFIMKNFDFIDNLKLRASIGKLGNDRIAAFQYLRLYNLGNSGYSFGQSPVQSSGLTSGVTPNPNITWEVATLSNVGLDGEFWNGLFGFTVDVFKQRRSNILATRSLSVPTYTGLALPNENIGIVENKGIEIEVSNRKRIGDLSYRIGGNIAFSNNKVININEASNVPEWQKAEGHAIGAGRYYISLGIIRTQEELDKIPVVPGTVVGDLKYEDVNGDGVIDAADQVRLDKTNVPRVTFGFNMSLEYKGLSLFANFAGATKVWQLYRFQALLGYNALQDLLENRYTQGSMDSKYPILPTQAGVSGLSSTFWLEDISYVRLKTLELGYDLSREWLSSFKINSLRLFVNGSNLFTLSKFKLYDPEGDHMNGFFYPQSKIYNVGVNLTF